MNDILRSFCQYHNCSLHPFLDHWKQDCSGFKIFNTVVSLIPCWLAITEHTYFIFYISFFKWLDLILWSTVHFIFRCASLIIQVDLLARSLICFITLCYLRRCLHCYVHNFIFVLRLALLLALLPYSILLISAPLTPA